MGQRRGKRPKKNQWQFQQHFGRKMWWMIYNMFIWKNSFKHAVSPSRSILSSSSYFCSCLLFHTQLHVEHVSIMYAHRVFCWCIQFIHALLWSLTWEVDDYLRRSMSESQVMLQPILCDKTNAIALLDRKDDKNQSVYRSII